MPETIDLPASELLGLGAIAIEVASRCGALVSTQRPPDLGVAATKSSATDVVTEMDRASEELARQILADRRPEDGILGEEGASSAGSTGITWVVDPIDGTVNYLYGLPEYSVSVAAVLGDPSTPGAWFPVAGAVVAPELGQCFHARRGGGAYLDDDRGSHQLSTTGTNSLAEALVATGFSYLASDRAWQGRFVAGLLPQVRDIRRAGSAALDLCNVAAGRHDGYVESRVNPWDMGAAWVIVEQAGGAVLNLEGERPDPRLTLAAGATLAPLLLAAVQGLLPDGVAQP